jgi:hypothetical protein
MSDPNSLARMARALEDAWERQPPDLARHHDVMVHLAAAALACAHAIVDETVPKIIIPANLFGGAYDRAQNEMRRVVLAVLAQPEPPDA